MDAHHPIDMVELAWSGFAAEIPHKYSMEDGLVGVIVQTFGRTIRRLTASYGRSASPFSVHSCGMS